MNSASPASNSAPTSISSAVDEEPCNDEALFEVASADNGNSSARFEDYIPTKNMVRAWMSEIDDIVG